MLTHFGIQSSANISLVDVLGNQVKITNWQRKGLPQDNFSTENAIIWENSDRWSLMIDPQMQANLWLKRMHSGPDEQLKVIKPTMD